MWTSRAIKCEEMLANVNHNIMLPNVKQTYYEMWTHASKCEPQYYAAKCEPYDMECELIVLWNENHMLANVNHYRYIYTHTIL